ncbi:MAG: biopolymer transporter ExbD [Lentisphaerae bacterium]|nr:biopolymer transporter ExbD [Lentisphaerota bacterium]
MNEQPFVRRPYGVHPTLLDVVCCLVFIFMLTSLLAVSSRHEARERTLPPLNLAEMDGSLASDPSNRVATVVVSVRPGPEYSVDNSPVRLSELRDVLAGRKASEAEIRGDGAVSYSCITDAIRLCNEAGINRLALTYRSKSNDN